MITIECENILDSCKRERFFLEQIKANLNHKVLSRTGKEYYEENRELFLEKTKQWRRDKFIKVSEIDKRYREQHNDQMKQYSNEYRKNIESKFY